MANRVREDLFTIGIIIAPHGVRGDLRIMPQTDFPDRFLEMDDCYIDGKVHHLTSARFHKQYILASFKEIPDRNRAELYSKKEIQVKREDLVPLPEGRYYIFDLIGLDVEDTQGRHLGTLTDVLQPGANDVYVVSQEGQDDQLFANIPSVVIKVDLENKKIIVDPPEWI